MDCRATLLSSPTDECGLCRAMAAALPINQRQLRLLRATVGRAFIVNDKAFGLGSARLDSARLGLAWHGLQGCFFVLLPCAMCFVVDLGTQQQQQQQLCNKRRHMATVASAAVQLFFGWILAFFFLFAVLCLCCTSMTNCCICKKRPAIACVCV